MSMYRSSVAAGLAPPTLVCTGRQGCSARPGGEGDGRSGRRLGNGQMKGTRGYAVGGSEWTAAVAMGNVMLWVS
jgi:hypothetical protein